MRALHLSLHPLTPLFSACVPLIPLVLLTACDLEKTADSPPRDYWTVSEENLSGLWSEKLDENVIYFAGDQLEFDFGLDSLTIRENHWSDVPECQDGSGVRDCTGYTWNILYRGTWSLEDSILLLAYHVSPPAGFPARDTSTRLSEFKAAPDTGRSLRLELLDTGSFIGGRQELLLLRPEDMDGVP